MSEQFVLVVDDEPDIRQLLQEILEDEGHHVVAVADAEAARAAVAEQRPDLVLLDIWMPDEDGISLLKSWQASDQLEFPVIMISGHGTIETAVEATRFGAVDFIEKPVSLAKLLLTVEKAFQLSAQAYRPDAKAVPELPFLTGNSQYVLGLRKQLDALAVSKQSVLLSGPAGCGREQYAQMLRQQGSDAALPFVKLRSESLSSSNFKRELFGAELSGAVSYGYLESAEGGILFLENPELLPATAAAALAECLASRSYTREAGNQVLPLNVRLVSSSRHSRQTLDASGEVEPRLLALLCEQEVKFLALKERPEDLPMLLENLVQWHVETEGLSYRHFTVAAQNRLRNHDWPGNLAELKNLVQRALILGGAADIDVAEVERLVGISNATELSDELISLGEDLPLREARARFERQYLLKCLQNSHGNIGELAKHVGMERTHLYRKLRSLDIDLDKVRE